MKDKVNKKVAFHTLGCKVNIYETENMRRLFEEEGYEVTPFDSSADVYVINTCSVTNIADRKSRQMIHKAKKMNPDAVIIATGCYVEGLSDDEIGDLGVDRIIKNREKNEIVAEAEELKLLKMGEHIRATVKIEDGCNQFCSYCIIPYRRGRVSCRPADSILRETEKLAAAGHKEIVLTGIHISSYGRDELVKLIDRIGRTEGVERIRLGSLEPGIIDDEFLGGLKQVPGFCPHFHLSLQSGCDRTLKAMNRKYTSESFASGVELIRKYYEHPAITTDIIAGFPGETEEDFEESLEFADRMKFYEMHIFPYSRRKGTAADRMPGQLTMAVKQERAARLEEVNLRNTREFIDYYMGREVEILTEEITEIQGKKYLRGFTDTYVNIILPEDEGRLNSLCRVRVSESNFLLRY